MIEFTSRARGKLRNAQAQLIDEAGVSKVMELTNKSKSVVYRWRDDNAGDFMALPEVMQVEGYLRHPVVTKEMVWFLGCEISGQSQQSDSKGSLSMQVAEMVEHTSRLVVETARARADGVITLTEANRLLELLGVVERLVPTIKNELIGIKVDGPLKVSV